ncbi:MAG: N-formylglutamate amidohydrolase [Myxococcales bacterium]|nr:N-formylglutamate amidohydrolase [Myxococcales bacterium]
MGAFFRKIDAVSESNVIVNVPHAGVEIPPEVAPTLSAPREDWMRDVDFAVDEIVCDAPDGGATLLASQISRFVVDLNRAPTDVPRDAYPDASEPLPTISYGRRGLIWLETTRGVPALRGHLTDTQFEQRMAYYTPYHALLASLIEERRQRFGASVLIDGHSMPSMGQSGHGDTGVRRADIVLGDFDGQSCAPQLTLTVEQCLLELGFEVVRNRPYRGGYDTEHYGKPDSSVHALQIEINRALYMDEDEVSTIASGLTRVREAMAEVVRRVVALRLGCSRA